MAGTRRRTTSRPSKRASSQSWTTTCCRGSARAGSTASRCSTSISSKPRCSMTGDGTESITSSRAGRPFSEGHPGHGEGLDPIGRAQGQSARQRHAPGTKVPYSPSEPGRIRRGVRETARVARGCHCGRDSGDRGRSGSPHALIRRWPIDQPTLQSGPSKRVLERPRRATGELLDVARRDVEAAGSPHVLNAENRIHDERRQSRGREPWRYCSPVTAAKPKVLPVTLATREARAGPSSAAGPVAW
jgi:hypothetical protein